MGEYASRKSDGERVKIGTCEDMYYLRHDQRYTVRAEHGSVDPVRQATAIRFRFPFPDEDHIAPGAFDDPFRKVRVEGWTPGDGFEHYGVQFTSPHGYVTSLPCPESAAGAALLAAMDVKVHRNGFKGSVFVSQQRELDDGTLATVCQCACGGAFRLSTWADAEPLVLALRSMADAAERGACGYGAKFLHTMADRVAAGYGVQAANTQSTAALAVAREG